MIEPNNQSINVQSINRLPGFIASKFSMCYGEFMIIQLLDKSNNTFLNHIFQGPANLQNNNKIK